MYGFRKKASLGPIGMEPTRLADPAAQAKQERTVKTAIAGLLAGVAILFVLAASGMIHLDPSSIDKQMTYVLVGIAVAFFLFVYAVGNLTSDEKKRVAVIIVLFAFAAIFWSAFEQAPTSRTLFARDFTDRQLGSFTIPATWFQSVNPLMIIIFGPRMGGVWVAMAKRGTELSSAAKFSLGLTLSGIGFLIMIFAANAVVASGGKALISP